MDKDGNLAIGYSASSSSIFPQIRYAGRLATDPLNTLGQGEATLFSGTGSQTGTSSRWGDYSALTVDPVDDCTFWYTTEYYPTTSQFNWRTRIGSFRFGRVARYRHRRRRLHRTPTPTPSPATRRQHLPDSNTNTTAARCAEQSDGVAVSQTQINLQLDR